MKVVTAKEMARIEKLSYQHGANEETFMNEAGRGVADHVLSFISKKNLLPRVVLLCGKGNNAGDAYVAGSLLLDRGAEVTAFAYFPLEESSSLCQLQANRFLKKQGKIHFIHHKEEISFGKAELIVDGILGTGFHGQVEGMLAHMIEKANHSQLPIVAIDIPSGIDGNTGSIGNVAIKATETVCLGLPKSGCFIGDAWNHVGKSFVFNFGLDPYFITLADEEFNLLTDNLIEKMIPLFERNRHKYQAGYVAGLGGSIGMPGAPLMASLSALRSGAGIVRLFHPEEMELEFSGAPLEIVRVSYQSGNFDNLIEKLNKAPSCFIGPGIGTSNETKLLLKNILPKIQSPCVIDAEALTIIAEEDLELPPNSILTPHQGEMKRLLHMEKIGNPKEFLNQCNTYANQKKVTLVLKGAPTFIFHPQSVCILSTRGNPGMATAGSGDILTGMIASFLAQGAPLLDAACLGVYLHGMAGEFAAERLTPYCMIATDILTFLPNVFFSFRKVWEK